MFSTTETRSELGSNKRGKLVPGIYQDVKLNSIETKKIGQSDLLEFTFVKEDLNKETNLGIWFPNGKAYVKDGETQEEANVRDTKNKIFTLLQVSDCFLTSEESDVQANTFEGIVEQIVERLKDKEDVWNEVSLNIKLIPDKNLKYAEFPKYNFIEVNNDVVTLSYSKWEKKNRVDPYNEDREAPSGTNALAGLSADLELGDAEKQSATLNDDLPF